MKVLICFPESKNDYRIFYRKVNVTTVIQESVWSCRILSETETDTSDVSSGTFI